MLKNIFEKTETALPVDAPESLPKFVYAHSHDLPAGKYLAVPDHGALRDTRVFGEKPDILNDPRVILNAALIMPPHDAPVVDARAGERMTQGIKDWLVRKPTPVFLGNPQVVFHSTLDTARRTSEFTRSVAAA